MREVFPQPPSASPPGSTGAEKPVPNLAALAALPSASLPDGALIVVLTLRDAFMLDRLSGLAADGITIVTASEGGAARWLRLELPDRRWTDQTAWVVDAAAGNDENPGSAAFPIASLEELRRRVGMPWIVRAATTVTIASNHDAPFVLWIHSVDNGSVTFRGTLTVQYTNAGAGFAAVTNINPATHTRPTVTDAAAPWAANVGNLIRTLGGAPKRAWISADLGAGVARHSNPLANIVDPTQTEIPTVTTFLVGETFEIVSVPRLLQGAVIVSGDIGAPTDNGVVFNELELGGTLSGQEFVVHAAETTKYAHTLWCRLRRFRALGGTHQVNGPHTPGGQVKQREASLCVVRAGLIGPGDWNIEGGTILLDMDTWTEGTGKVVEGNQGVGGSGLVIGQAAVFPSAGDGLVLTPTFGATVRPLAGGAVRVWGNTAPGYGVRVKARGTLGLPVGFTPTVTGVTGDFIAGNDTTIRPFDDVTGVYAAAVATTWANLSAATPLGFGGNCIDPVSGAAIVVNQ